MSFRIIISLLAALALVACSKEKPADTAPMKQAKTAAPAAPAAPAAAPKKAEPHPIIAQVGGEAANVFTTRCATCHGMTGKGDGAAAQALNPKPRSFEDAAWQGTITDDHIKKVIIGGGAAVGKSQLMAPNPDLKDKPEVLDGLLKIVRGMKKG